MIPAPAAAVKSIRSAAAAVELYNLKDGDFMLKENLEQLALHRERLEEMRASL
jgi:predicted porin